MRLIRKLKEYWMELVAFCDLELFVWSITRRYYNRPTESVRRMLLDGVITLSGIVLCILPSLEKLKHALGYLFEKLM